MAEETRLIIALDRWMLGEACRLIHKVARAGKPLRVSVNISPKHFREPDFVSALEELIHASGIDPSLLMLEVTEGLMIQDVEEVIGKMKAVSRLGVRFSIDDFGTGYSSLAYIKRLPIHELKIDQSFVGDAPNDPNDALLVEMIHTIASFLNLETVAEGVETELHLDYLAKYPNLIYQGYLFGRPVPADMWLEDHFPTLGHDTGDAAASSSETEGSSQNDPS